MGAVSPVHATAFAAIALLCACSGGAGNGRSLLVVTLDTTRPDALSLYGGPPTPGLERLAREGVVFERAYTAAPITLPAHATLFSGLYPPRHGVRDNGQILSEGAHTLAELLLAEDYQTAAFVGAVVLDPAFGLQQGFERYDAPRPAGGPARAHAEAEAERPARAVIDAALAWLRARDRSRPYFLWVHLYDAHTPYEPPAEFAGQTPRARYDGEVRSADSELQRLFEHLRAEPTLDETLVLVAGDHGEGFGEHGEEGHSVHCYETTLRVPLVVRAPFWARLAPGSRSRELVALADLVPTACEALGIETPADLDGRSFWSAAAPEERGIYFESFYGYLNFGWSPLAGWIDARGKYLHASDERFFDLQSDPLEERDLLAERAADVTRAQRGIAELERAPKLAAAAPQVSEALLQSLRGLGYAAVGGESRALPHPLEDTGLPSPERMREPYATSLSALELAKRGELAEAERLFRAVLEVNPGNPFVLDQLAVCLLQRGDFEQAAATLRSILDLGHRSTPGVWFKLARCLEELQQTPEAIEALERALALDPTRAPWLVELARLLRASGRTGEAAQVEQRIAALAKDG